MLNAGARLAQSSSSNSFFSLFYSIPLLALGILGGWVLMFNTESYPILLRFWGKVVPLGLLFIGVGVLFVWSSYMLESNIFKIGGTDITISELQLFGSTVPTFFEKSVESSRVKGYEFSSSFLVYLTSFFSGFSSVWLLGLVILLVLF